MNLKVISLNLWEGHLLQQCVDFLRQQNADILLLQEVYNSIDTRLAIDYRALQFMQQELPDYHFDFAPAMLDILPNAKVEQGLAIASKLPVIGSDFQFFDVPYRERNPFDPKEFPTTPRILQHNKLDAGDSELNVYNFQGVWDLDGDNFSHERKNMSQVILKAIADNDRIILGGDTNAKPGNQAIKMIEEQLVNVYRSQPPATSFNMRRKDNPGYANACVDMIFVSQTIRVDAWSYPDVDVSDHLPVVAKLNI